MNQSVVTAPSSTADLRENFKGDLLTIANGNAVEAVIFTTNELLGLIAHHRIALHQLRSGVWQGMTLAVEVPLQAGRQIVSEGLTPFDMVAAMRVKLGALYMQAYAGVLERQES